MANSSLKFKFLIHFFFFTSFFSFIIFILYPHFLQLKINFWLAPVPSMNGSFQNSFLFSTKLHSGQTYSTAASTSSASFRTLTFPLISPEELSKSLVVMYSITMKLTKVFFSVEDISIRTSCT